MVSWPSFGRYWMNFQLSAWSFAAPWLAAGDQEPLPGYSGMDGARECGHHGDALSGTSAALAMVWAGPSPACVVCWGHQHMEGGEFETQPVNKVVGEAHDNSGKWLQKYCAHACMVAGMFHPVLCTRTQPVQRLRKLVFLIQQYIVHSVPLFLFQDPHVEEYEDKDWTFVIENVC